MVHAIALAEWHAVAPVLPALREPAGVAGRPGHVLRCTECGHQQFPRTDPAVIMMVTDGDRALLGRQAAWPEGRYSTLAGFVEPGESLEEAVVREVRGGDRRARRRRRLLRQPAVAVPASLMVGFFARATSTDIHVDGDEIEDARWFTRTEMRAEAEAGALVLPGGISISRSLVERWYGGPLPGSLVRPASDGEASDRSRPGRRRASALTCASDGFVCAVPSAKTRVGTVWLPPLTCSTMNAASGTCSMSTTS